MHPEPIVRARPATADEMNRTAKSLLKKAGELGWSTSASYARGTAIDQYGNPTRVVDSLIVRLEFVKAAARAIAIWIDGTFETAFIWAKWSPLEMVGSRAVAGWVASVPKLTEAAA